MSGYALGDSSVIAIRRDGTADVLTDARLAGLGAAERARYRQRLAAGYGYDDEHRTILRQLIEAERAGRNRPDDYWIAEAVPEAAAYALTGQWSRDDVLGLLLVTDGATAVLSYGLCADWAAALRAIEHDGPDAFLAMIEAAESADPNGARWARSKPSDDKTLIALRLS